MKMWGIATSKQGGRGLASFVGTMFCCECHRSSEMTIVNECPLSKYVCAIYLQCSMAMGAVRRSKFAVFRLMMTSPYECNILEWNEKAPTPTPPPPKKNNKQLNSISFMSFENITFI